MKTLGLVLALGIAAALILQMLGVNWSEWVEFKATLLAPVALVVADVCFLLLWWQRRGTSHDDPQRENDSD